MNFVPATLLADFYKVSHKNLYPANTQYVYSTFTPRMSRDKNINSVVAFGFQGFIKKYLIDYFDTNFFNRDWNSVKNEYERIIKYSLGINNPDSEHIKDLHTLGYLPIEIKAVKEGLLIPIQVPVLTIENTNPKFFWLTNYLETIMSCEIWMPMTSATTSHEYRKIMDKYAEETSDNTGFVDFQGHDFSMRGMSCLEAAMTSGAGHLLSFKGSDTIPAIHYLEHFYNADITKELVSTSIPASEHSVAMAGGMDEYTTFKRIITEVHPSGFVSIVSDTWDLWNVLNNILPSLKNEIMSRDGRIVCRPDSGVPEDIICGDPNGETESERKGVIQLLWDHFGGTVNSKGYKELDTHVGAIYGDAITLERCETICKRLKEKGFASTNLVMGIGSFSYQWRTRDTFGFALKATDFIIDDIEYLVFKDPVTDKAKFKKSQRGRVVVLRENDTITYKDNLYKNEALSYKNQDLLETVFLNGDLIKDYTLQEIRDTLKYQK